MQSRYDTECQRICKLAKDAGYTRINIDYDPPTIGYKSKGYEVSAEAPYQGRIILATATSWAKCYAAAMEYLK